MTPVATHTLKRAIQPVLHNRYAQKSPTKSTDDQNSGNFEFLLRYHLLPGRGATTKREKCIYNERSASTNERSASTRAPVAAHALKRALHNRYAFAQKSPIS